MKVKLPQKAHNLALFWLNLGSIEKVTMVFGKRMHDMKKFASLVFATALTAALAVTPALADDHHGRHDDHDFHGRVEFVWHDDIHHFHEHDYDVWRGGSWYHGFHSGRGGWWWIVGDQWYFYPRQVFPYPDPYTPPVVVVESPSPAGVAPSAVYYCSNPAGYYPYVAQCFTQWEKVVTIPTAAPQVVQPPMIVQQPAPQQQVAPSGGQREADDRQLNALGVEFQDIDLTGQKARAKLKALEKKVEAFRQSLYAHGGNEVDIIKDADALEHRIAEQREKLPSHHHDAAPPAEAVPSR